MKVSISRRTLHAGLQAVTRACAGNRSSLPILYNVHLSVNENNGLTLRATDLDLTIETTVECVTYVDGEGECTLPAKTLQDIMAALPDGDVTIGSDGGASFRIACGKSSYRIHGLPPGEYPPVPEVGGSLKLSVPADTLRGLISRVQCGIAKDDTRPVLTGTLFQVDDKELRLVTTDTHRLCVASGDIETDQMFEEFPIIPGRATYELQRLLKDSGEHVECRFNKNMARFAVSGAALTTRLIEGVFPKYERIIPKQHSIRVRVAAANLASSIKRAAVVARENANRLTITVTPESGLDTDRIVLTANSGELGSCREELGCQIEGGETTFCVNAEYLQEAVAAISTEEVALDLTEPLSPFVVRPVENGEVQEDGSCLTVMMPMNLGA